MNLRDLNYLSVLAEQGHFGKAAAKCFISQPTLSMQIKKLEQELGVALLERSGKSILLTEVGHQVVEHAREILQQTKQIREIAAAARDPEAGELKVGIIPTLAPYFLPRIIPRITSAFPKLKLYLFEDRTAHLIAKLSQGIIDTAILALPIIAQDLTSYHLFDEAFRLAVPSGHSLGKRKLIKQADLTNEKLLLLEEGHCLRDQALAICATANALENKNFQGTSLETLRHMIAAGMGVTLMPELACLSHEQISYVAFSTPKPSRAIGMLWRTSSVKIPLLIAFGALIRKVMC
ncbi:MAG TPA: LysR substrate-binding domain-containing protein [Gammaproteobacteria bacterium]|nr:LysR substrate-binding domain-containing protein [Gammaproteobacteria bacterium]